MFAIWTFIKTRLSFIDRSELQSIKANFRRTLFDALFFDRDLSWFLRPKQGRLFFIAIGPHDGDGAISRVRRWEISLVRNPSSLRDS
jgi:hypothetical protein